MSIQQLTYRAEILVRNQMCLQMQDLNELTTFKLQLHPNYVPQSYVYTYNKIKLLLMANFHKDYFIDIDHAMIALKQSLLFHPNNHFIKVRYLPKSWLNFQSFHPLFNSFLQDKNIFNLFNYGVTIEPCVDWFLTILTTSNYNEAIQLLSCSERLQLYQDLLTVLSPDDLDLCFDKHGEHLSFEIICNNNHNFALKAI